MITNTSMQCALRCPREYYYAHERRLVPIGLPRPILLGKAFDNARGEVMSGKSADEALFGDVALQEHDSDILRLLLIGWVAMWGGCGGGPFPGTKWEPHIKFEFDYAGLDVRGEFDGAHDSMGLDKTSIYELKLTTSDISPGSLWWERTRLDTQIAMYLFAARQIYNRTPELTYDAVHFPDDIKRKLATPEGVRKYRKDGVLYAGQRAEDETEEEHLARIEEAIATDPGRFYQRRIIRRSNAELDEFAAEVVATQEVIRLYSRLETWPRSMQQSACNKFGHRCGYYEVCCGNAAITDPTLFKASDYDRMT